MSKKDKSCKEGCNEDSRKSSSSSHGRKQEVSSKDLRKVTGGGMKSEARKAGGSQESFEEVEEV
jgi:hypothetical protein